MIFQQRFKGNPWREARLFAAELHLKHAEAFYDEGSREFCEAMGRYNAIAAEFAAETLLEDHVSRSRSR